MAESEGPKARLGGGDFLIVFLNMATKYGLAIAGPFVKGTAGSTMETLRRNHNKDNLIQVASSLGWLVRDTLGVDTFKACLNLVESSPACGGGMERLAKAYRLNRLGPYREGTLNAARITSDEFIAHMAKYGLNSYGDPLEDEDEADAAAAALAASSQQQQQLSTQRRRDSRDPSGGSLFPRTGVGAGDDDVRKVSAPIANDDHDRVVDVDDPPAGNVRTPAATDPLLAGGTVGRMVDQSQTQAGSQVPADHKKKLCKSVWRDDVCGDWTCDRAHPPRCGNPLCYPVRRRDCQHWHRVAGRQQQQQQQQQQQGNGSGAGPGRAAGRQPQGNGSGSRPGPPTQRQRQQQQRQQRRQQQRQSRPPRPQSQPQPRLHQRQQRQQQAPPPPPPLAGFPQQQQRQFPSYRDVAALGASRGISNPIHGSGTVGTGPGGFAHARPDPATLSTVVAAVMAVLGGGI